MTDSTPRNDTELAPPSYDDINTPMVLMVGVIAALVTLITIMFVQGLYYQWEKSQLRARAKELVEMPAVKEINRQKSVLTGGDGVASIDVAMKEVIEKFGKPASN